MRFSLKFVFGVILAAASLAAQSAPSSFSISIKLAGPATKKADSGVAVGVVLTNTSNEQLHFMDYRPADFDYTIDVRDSQGQTAKAKEPDTRSESPFRARVMPGKRMCVTIAPDNLFQMNQPGDYTIQVSRSSLEDPQHPVKSSKITVTITP